MCAHTPDKAREKSQSPYFGGPHQVQIGILPALILYKYYFGQSLDIKNEIWLCNVRGSGEPVQTAVPQASGRPNIAPCH